jgi:hypothetical protein
LEIKGGGLMLRTVEATFAIQVEVDENKFTPKFIAEFKENFYSFETIDVHIQHIALLEVHGLLNKDFTEGYGRLDDMGIKAKILYTDSEIQKED